MSIYKLEMSKRIKITKKIYLKEVTIKDVNYILKLRTNKNLSKYLNPTSNNKNDQIAWLKKYFQRRKAGKEFYYIFQLSNKKNLGIGRIIHLKKNLFHFGGWILEKNAEPGIALECCLSIYEYAFNYLKYKKCLNWINIENTKVINYHKILGSTFYKKTKKEIFLEFTKNSYKELKMKFNYYYL